MLIIIFNIILDKSKLSGTISGSMARCSYSPQLAHSTRLLSSYVNGSCIVARALFVGYMLYSKLLN